MPGEAHAAIAGDESKECAAAKSSCRVALRVIEAVGGGRALESSAQDAEEFTRSAGRTPGGVPVRRIAAFEALFQRAKYTRGVRFHAVS
jgi:hypothetical protein